MVSKFIAKLFYKSYKTNKTSLYGAASKRNAHPYDAVYKLKKLDVPKDFYAVILILQTILFSN